MGMLTTRSFGHEQALVEDDRLKRWMLRLVGNPHAGARLRLRSLRQAVRYLQREHGQVMGGARLLDAGSGKGEYAFALARQFPELSVTAVEMDGGKVRRGSRIAERLGLTRVTFVEADLTSLEWRGEFDVAICLDVLEHVDDDEGALRAIREALRPGGHLILHVPGPEEPRVRMDEGHLRHGYSNEVMRAMLSRAGFDVERMRNPIGPLGRLADDVCEVLSERPLLRGAVVPLCASLVWLDRWGSERRVTPRGAGLLAVATNARPAAAGPSAETGDARTRAPVAPR